jgi:anti-sigma B factor antagonist
MALDIEQREHEGVRILDLKGQLTMGPEDQEFRTAIQGNVRAGAIKIILNFEQLKKLDSVGLGTLVFCHVTLRRAGGKLALFGLSQTHMELLVLAKLETVFDAFGSEQDAVNSFFPDRAVRHYDILEFVHELEDQRDPASGKSEE